MGVCNECSYEEGICPLRSPYRTTCIYKEEPEVKMDKAEIRSKRREAMKKDYLDGMTVNELAVKYGLHRSNVAKNLNKVGITLGRDKHTCKEKDIPTEVKDRILELLDGGYSYPYIAKKMGTTVYYVKKVKGEANKKSKVQIVEIKKEEPAVMTGYVECKSFTFYMPGEQTKPFPGCFAAEKDNSLVWGIRVNTIEDLLNLGKDAKGTIVIDGDYLNILPVHLIETGGTEVHEC